ncbi:hypothetical protein C8R46DRAFT_433913 [Mycena filopes]|nr:hypothetical protein C8R46DRAFT_433913 [Mycena filopes]
MIAIDEEIALLHHKRQSLVRLRSQNSAIGSPLRRIPPEVLAEIFTWTLPLVNTLSERERFSSTDSPWFLTYVSRSWRATAISTPSLWSVVAIAYYQGLNPTGLYPLPMLETHIGRAQRLKIHFYGEEDCESGPQVEVFEYLASHSSRWEELSLALTSALVPLLGSLQDRVPSLCRLDIQWSDEASQSNVDSIDCFERAPCLVDFTLFNQFHSIPIRLPVEQLTRHQLDGPWELHRGILVRGLNLVELRIIIGSDEPWPPVTQVIQLPCLRRLYVNFLDVLDFLDTPALDEFALRVWSGHENDIQRTLGSFTERSGCTLRRLCLYGCVDVATLGQMLNTARSITELAIIKALEPDDDRNDFPLLGVLTMTPGTHHVAPHLHSIFLGCERDNTLDLSMCLAMIHSRWKQPHQALRAAALMSVDPLGPVDDFNMRREGLDLLILDGSEAERTMANWTYETNWN